MGKTQKFFFHCETQKGAANFCVCLLKPLGRSYSYARARFSQTFIKNLTGAEWIKVVSIAPCESYQ